MNVWKMTTLGLPDGRSAFAMLRTISVEHGRLLSDRFKGDSFAPEEWKPMPLVRNPINKDEAASQALPDLALVDAYGSIAVLSRDALDVLLPHIAHCGEVLPMLFGEAPYSIFNITRVIDALDEPASDVKYFEDGGVMRIARFEFKLAMVKNELLFKIPQGPGANNFVTDRFVKIVRDAGLTGFDFKKVWSDEPEKALAGPALASAKPHG